MTMMDYDFNITDFGNTTENSCSLLYEDDNFVHFLMHGVLLSVVAVIGFIGNVISITILSRPNMRSSINCLLVGLASFDCSLLITSLLMFGLSAIAEYTGAFMWYRQSVYPYIVQGVYPLGVVAQTGSVYLTVTVTLERYVAVCHPLRARSLCTYGRAKLYVVLVVLFSFVYNSPRFWEVTYKTCENDNVTYASVEMTTMRQNSTYIKVYINWLYLIVMYLVPFLSLLVFNFFIYKQVRLANKELQRLSRLQRKELSLAVMLLFVVIVFFVCNILALIVNVLEMMGITIFMLTMLSNLLVTVNSSVNFIIYCIFGQKFRRLFLQLFCFGALKNYIGLEGSMADSGICSNSIYGSDRTQSNGRTPARNLRLSTWNASHQSRGLHQQPGRAWNYRTSVGIVDKRHLRNSINSHESFAEKSDQHISEISLDTDDREICDPGMQ